MKKIVSYLLVILWVTLIFILSSESGDISGNSSSSILYDVFSFIYKLFNIDTASLDNLINTIHNPLREFMHFFEYFILSILVINALSQSNIKKIYVITFIFCLFYSITDEVHQLFISGRTFEFFDLFMDFLGYSLGIVMCKGIKR